MTSLAEVPLPAGIGSELDLVLRERFGFDAFRPGQREALLDLLSNRRLLCIQPTGHGKSLLYQLPSVLLPGLTLVISPLLALMRDQLGQLEARFGIPAASINSDQTDEENRDACIRAKRGGLRILFVAPEQLESLRVFEFLLTLPISMLVIDEAHCISSWGHDFRPAYRKIADAIRAYEQRFPEMLVLALTATADHRTEDDIRVQLQTRQPLLVRRQSMDRPNLSLRVRHVPTFPEKLVALYHTVNELPKPGLIYCATRENVELTAAFLRSMKINTAAYHAGFRSEHKRELQSDLLRGRYDVISATNALGMGIDKGDIRFVVHFDIPGSATAYYQEVGRAGRDGQPAAGVLLYNPSDLQIQRFFIESAAPGVAEIQKVLDAIPSGSILRQMEIKAATELHPTLVRTVLAELEEQRFIVREALKQDKRRQGYRRIDTTARRPNAERYQRQRDLRYGNLNAMAAFAEGRIPCAMKELRHALGDLEAGPCERCWLCRNEQPAPRLEDREVEGTRRWLDRRNEANKQEIEAKSRRNRLKAGQD